MTETKKQWYPMQSPYKRNRAREVRDLYNKLGKKFRYHIVLQFFKQNYFIQEGAILTILRQVDDEPVDLNMASIQYKTAIDPTFNL